MASNRLAGTAYMAINGKTVALVGDFEWNTGTVTRESLVGMDGVHGFKEKPKPSKMKATLRDLGNVSVAAFNNLTDVTITVELANGKRVTMRNAWQVGEMPAKAEDGTVDLEFDGQPGAITETLSV